MIVGGRNIKDYSGKIYGTRSVVNFVEVKKFDCGAIESQWEYKCDCGVIGTCSIAELKRKPQCDICTKKLRGHFGCVVESCDKKHYCKSFCKFHHSQFYKGWLTPTGERTETYNGKASRDYENCKIEDCEKDHTKRGFCDKHYKWYRKGQCDYGGVILRAPKKVCYVPGVQCVVAECTNRPRRKGFCKSHSTMFYNGKYTASGKLSETYDPKKQFYSKDHKCLVCGVQDVKFVLGFCKNHYAQYSRGKYDEHGNINDGYTPKKRVVKTCKLCDRIRNLVGGLCPQHLEEQNKGNIARIYDFAVEMEDRVCDGGCGKKFRVMKGSACTRARSNCEEVCSFLNYLKK
jgi:hypothetical protein